MNTAKTKRLAAFIISLVMLLSLIPTQALAAPTNERYGASAIAALENGENFILAYNTLKSGVEAGQERISFADANHSIKGTDFPAILDVYFNDNPQHFWLGKGATSFFSGNKLTAVELTYTFTGDELTTAKSKFEAAAAAVLSGITDDMSQFEIELYLHDYLVSHVTYDLDAPHAHDAYGALVEGRAVCEGYARAFQYLLQQAGIPSYVVTGQSKGEDHAWNLVKIDGEYYYVDVTWDDQDNDNKYYSYFNVTTETLCEDHTIAQQIYTLPNCTATAANYFTVKGGKIESGDIDTLSRLLDAGNLFARVYVTGDADAFATWIRTNIFTIADKMGATNVTGFNSSRLGREFLLQVDGDYTHVHDLTHVDAVASTCHEEGNVEYWSCSKCGKLYADAAATRELTSVSAAIDPNNHDGNTELRNASVATCEKTGYTGDTYCLGCNAKLTTGTAIPKAHSMAHVDAVPGTCKDNGTKEHWHCSKCNKDFADKDGNTVLTDLSTPKDPANHTGGTEVRNASEATCVQPGYTGDTYCLGCNAKLTSGTETHKDHSTTYVAAVPATCKDTGTKEHWHCASCNKNFADKDGATVLTDLTTAKDPANHAGGTEVRNASEATCVKPGYTGDTYCLGCNAKLTTGTTIPKAHSMTHADAVPGTCKDKGTKEHWHCSKCDKDFADKDGDTVLTDLTTPKDPANHAGGTKIQDEAPATCTIPGYTGDTYCLGCNSKLATGTVIPASHKLNHVEGVAATCKATGTAEHWHCTVCNENFSDADGKNLLSSLTLPIDPNNHVGGTRKENANDPGCDHPGYTGDIYCVSCDVKLADGQEVPAGHTTTQVNEIPATCKDTGTAAHWHCTRCDKDFEDAAGTQELTDLTIAKNPVNHAGGTELRNSTDPSCKADGYTGDTYCLGCNERIGTGTTIPTSHVLTAVPAKAATCTTIGTKGYWQCSCGKVYANDANRTPMNSADDCALPIDPTNHVGFKEAWETNADSHWHACIGCTEGKSELIAHVFDNSCDTTCAVCGYTRTITHTPAVNYSYDTNGHWKVCSVCSKTIEAIEAHKGGTATCKDKAVCSVCGQPYGSLGTHTVANWTQVSAPTFTKAGEKKGTCSVCDTEILDSIPMLTMPTDNKDNGSTKLEKSDLTTVPSALSNIESMNTLDKIKEALRKSISQQSSAVSESNTKYYDVVLYVYDANGNPVPMSAENLPENGEVTILLAYPEGTNKDNFVFFASHVITDAKYGEVGTVETPTVTATDNGLEIKLHGTSPVALGWYQKVSSSRPQGPTVITTAGSQRTSAATGDISILAYALAASGSLGLGAVMITTKRRRH
jgi:transposase-like protein